MLGYVRAYKPELRFREYDLYRGVYCSICKRLLRAYSPPAQLFLSYDITLLAIVLMAVRGEDAALKETCCCYNPLKKCHACLGADQTLDFCADVSVIMAYHKLRDNIQDKSFFGRLVAYLLLPIVSLMHRKAARRQPEAEKIAARAMEKQSETEKNEASSTDAAADPTATALAELLLLGTDGEGDVEKLRRFGYLLGRYVYLIDAVDDVTDDLKSGGFNPLKKKYVELQGEADGFYDYARQLLDLNIGELVRCFEGIELQSYGDIIYNVLFYGLYNSSLFVLKKYKKGGAQHEKSI